MITSYKELPVGKWLDILDAAADTALDEVGKQVRILGILADMDDATVLALPLTEYSEMAAASMFLNDDAVGAAPRLAKSYTLGAFTLVPCVDVRHFTTAQYIDFQTFCPLGHRGIAEVLSCFLIPKGCKYNTGYDVVEVQQAIKDYLDVHEALTLYAFFFISLETSTADMLTYSRKMAMGLKDSPQKKEILQRIAEQETLFRRNGVGS